MISKANTKKFFLKLWKVVYKTIWSFNLHGGVENAGYLSFSMLFAIFPFAIFFTSMVGWFGHSEFGTELLENIKLHLPEDIANSLFSTIDSVINASVGSILSLATISLLWSASAIVQAIKNILNKAYRIRNIPSFFVNRAISILQFLLMVFFVIALILTTIILPKILVLIDRIMPVNFITADSILFTLKPFFLMGFLFIFVEFLYFFMPARRKMKIKDVFWGGILATFGWIISGSILTFYLSTMATYNKVYGSFAGIIITLFFFFIMSCIFIFGAEFNYNLKENFMGKIKVKKNKNNSGIIK